MKLPIEQDRDYYIVVPIIVAKFKMHVEKETGYTIPISVDLKEVDLKMLEPEYRPVDEIDI